MKDEILEKRANEFRTLQGIGLNDCVPLKSLLYKLDVLTVFRPLGESLSGMAIKITDQGSTNRFILVNSNKSIGNQHFTICHELYHLYIQQDFTSQACHTGRFLKTDREEYNADVFASHLLLPEQGIKSLIPDKEFGKNKISLSTILKIEHFFCCSRAALLYRLKEMKIVDGEFYDRYAVDVKRGALQTGYNIALYQPGNHNLAVGDYGPIARNLFENEKISENFYFTLLMELGMNTEELEDLENRENEG